MDDVLVEELLKPGSPERATRVATAGLVTSTSPLKVEIDGVPVTVKRLTSYTPAIDDRALLLAVGLEWVAIGAIA